MRTLYYSRMESPLGRLLVGATDRGLAVLEFLSARVNGGPADTGNLSGLGGEGPEALKGPGFSRAEAGQKEAGALAPEGRRTRELWVESPERLEPYIAQLNEYFAGRRRSFDMPLDLEGTDFQKRCWQALCEIPYGETTSYAQIAVKVGSPKAVRAVGQANHYNPLPIVVPCHRVITSSGTLGGYGGGLDVKRRLLELERGESPLL